jgi:hypothetical protein
MSALSDLQQTAADLVTAVNNITALLSNSIPVSDVVAVNTQLRASVSSLQALVPPPAPSVASSVPAPSA